MTSNIKSENQKLKDLNSTLKLKTHTSDGHFSRYFNKHGLPCLLDNRTNFDTDQDRIQKSVYKTEEEFSLLI